MEYLGAEFILSGIIMGGQLDGKKVVGRLLLGQTYEVGATYDFAVPERHLKFFDRATEKENRSEGPGMGVTTPALSTEAAIRPAAESCQGKSMGAAQSPMLGAAMFGPAILYIVLLIGAPFLLAIFYAFSDARIGSGELHYVGFENFRSILQSPSFIKAIKNSIVFTVVTQIVVIICSNILSIVLEKKFLGRGLVRFLILLPWVAPVSLGTIGWKWITDSIYSPITWILIQAHLVKPYDAPMWLGQPYLAMASVILVHCWRLIPFSTVILLAGRTAIPKEIPEAAAIDGAGFWRTLFQITLPMMKPILSVALLFGTIFTFTDMTVVYILTARRTV